MRKSNLLLLAALLVLLVSLGMYNVALKAEYGKGLYNDRYKDYSTFKIKDFQAIDIKSDSRLNVQVMQGEFKVRVHNRDTAYVQVTKVGHRLQITLPYPGRGAQYDEVIITCPRISEINLSGIKNIKRKIAPGTVVRMQEWEDVAMVNVYGMTLDSLLLKMDHASLIKLNHNKIGKLHSITGISPGAMSKLEINFDNTIQEADLTVKHHSKLSIQGDKIARLRYHFGDSTQISFSGAALGLLKQ